MERFKQHTKFLKLVAQLDWNESIPVNNAIIYQVEELLESFDEDSQKDYRHFLYLIKSCIYKFQSQNLEEVDHSNADFTQLFYIQKQLLEDVTDGNVYETNEDVKVAFSNLYSTRCRLYHVSKGYWIPPLTSEDLVIDVGVDGWVMLMRENEDGESSKIYYFSLLTRETHNLPDLQLIVRSNIHGCHSDGGGDISSCTSMVVYQWSADSLMVYRHFQKCSFWTGICFEIDIRGSQIPLNLNHEIKSKMVLKFGYLWITDSFLICLYDWESSISCDCCCIEEHLLENSNDFLVSSTVENLGFLLSVQLDSSKAKLMRIYENDPVLVCMGLDLLRKCLGNLHLEGVLKGMSLIKDGFLFSVERVRRLHSLTYFVAYRHAGYARHIEPFKGGHLYLSGFNNDLFRYKLEDEWYAEEDEGNEDENDNNTLTILPCPFIDNNYCSCRSGWFFTDYKSK